MASLIAGKFSVVTTLPRSMPAIEHNLLRYGLAARCAQGARLRRRRCSSSRSRDRRRAGAYPREIGRALKDDHAEAIVLGCAGMTDLAAVLASEHDVPVLDGVACAVKLAESLVGLGLATSKRGGYAPPLAKPYAGEFKRFSPR